MASHAAPVVAVATALGATATAIIGYLQSERVLRPVAVAALRGGVPENYRAAGVILRQVLTWVLSTGVPVLAIVLALVASKFQFLTASAERLTTPILIMAIAALLVGLAGTVLVAMAIADPLRQLRWALGEVQRGNYNAHMQIYDASELGLLQAGFNDMVRDLAERQRLRDLFGRYVGEDVARRALERGTELGGQERDVAVLFVDLVGSTQLASNRPASEVVSLLNEFFRVVVDTVGRHGGFVNKFQGDAALAIFGAPIEHPDASGAALAASRELHDELLDVLGSEMEFGIGVSAGRAIAGHIGAQARFEYTVIGDPVNEAARLTELAKLEEGHVLASAIAVSGALDAEALCWDVGEIVELRGRTAPTQLARPLNLVESAPGIGRRRAERRRETAAASCAWRPSWRVPSSRPSWPAFFAGRFAGPRARRSASSSAARSSVIDSTSSPLRRLALVSPSVTYGPNRPSLMTIGLPVAGSAPNSRSGGAEAPCPARRLGSE